MAAQKMAYAFANVTASQTDNLLVTGATNRIIVVYGVVAVCGGTATTLTFNTAPGGSSGSAISILFANAANGGFVLPYSEVGWFQTNASDYLTCTTGSGSTTGVQVIYRMEPKPGSLP